MFGIKWCKTSAIPALFLVVALLTACANIGRPDGGPYDESTPVLLKTSPAINTINYTDKKIELYFNEYVKVENQSEKVIISPPQINPPKITSQPTRKVSVTLQENLLPNTTYTIDFSDAIVDNNEGNPLGNYAFTFSTGSVVDTLQISGHVLEAKNLDPIKGIYVGVHPIHEGDTVGTDSAFFKNPLTRISRTDGQGFFCVKGIAPGTYQVVALQDGDQNFIFNQKSEQIAFDSKPVNPTTTAALRNDTVWLAPMIMDTIRVTEYTRYLPDDLLLRAFKEDASSLYFIKAERLVPQNFQIYFSGPSPELPRLTGLNFDANDLLLEHSLHNDTLRYWLKDTILTKIDTLKLAIEYLHTDTTQHLSYTSDTLTLALKFTKRNFEAPKKKKKKDGEEENQEPEIQFLPVRITPAVAMDITDNFYILFSEPIIRFDSTAIHLEEKNPEDTIWKPKEFLFEQDTLNLMSYTVLAEWDPGKEYMMTLDSASFHGIYGTFNNRVKSQVKVRSLDEYGSLFFDVRGVEGPAFIELMTDKEAVVRKEPVEKGRSEFYFLRPGKYYARLTRDTNDNGKWNTGLYPSLQPEEVYYYPQSLEIRALFDINQNWDLYALPFDKQKPEELKPKDTTNTRTVKTRNATRRR